jgi:hypothetical protein
VLPKDKELAPSCNHPKSATIADGLSLSLGEALADPIVRALMAADGVEPASVEKLIRRMAAGASGGPSWT